MSRVSSSVDALGGAFTAPSSTISFASIFLPYRFLFASLSGRRVDPSRETPANAPRAREYDRMSARRVASVSAEAVRPTGPAERGACGRGWDAFAVKRTVTRFRDPTHGNGSELY